MAPPETDAFQIPPPAGTVSMTVLRVHLGQLARCHAWAARRLLQAVETLGDAEYRRDAGLFFRSVHGTLNHWLVAERELWFSRFAHGRSPALALDAELHTAREPLVRALYRTVDDWQPFIDSCADARLEGVLQYLRLNGKAVEVPFASALAHVFNHATHHRGQVSAALTAMGRPAPEMDWVYALQEMTP